MRPLNVMISCQVRCKKKLQTQYIKGRLAVLPTSKVQGITIEYYSIIEGCQPFALILDI